MAKKAAKKKPKAGKTVEMLTHDDAKRKNIPTAEFQSVVAKEEALPKTVKYPRNTDLDPQLVWRGKDEQDWSELVVHAPPLYIQEKVHPKVLIDDLIKQTTSHQPQPTTQQLDLFADFNGVPDGDAKTEFYQHDQNWSNRMILGDSLQVMASLAEREGLRGKVQCIYLDPPYGIKFNSNFQWSTTSRDVKDGKADQITREPEQVKAFRDTWRDGIHSYLTYLRDRLTVARDLLTNSGSIFVQIGDENVHLVRSLLDEVFGTHNFVSLITLKKTSGAGSPSVKTDVLPAVFDQILWYGKSAENVKYRQPFVGKDDDFTAGGQYSKLQLLDFNRRAMTASEKNNRGSVPADSRIYRHDTLTAQSAASTTKYPWTEEGRSFTPTGYWKTPQSGMTRLSRAWRVGLAANSLSYVRFIDDFPVSPITNLWTDTLTGSFTEDKVYVVQTAAKIVQRCLLMTTDPGDLVLDPTCGSGTTAYVAEQWGRRWITVDTSRVALALARARIMGARYPYYLLADSRDGQLKESEVTGMEPSSQPVYDNIRHGFVYERVPHITLKSIANNAEIDVIWEKWQEKLSAVGTRLSAEVGRKKPFEEWEVPREAEEKWSAEAKKLHKEWWTARIARQKEIDDSIAQKAEFEYLYDKPYQDNKKVRVAGPFTVESLSPHRVLGVDENDELIDPLQRARSASKGDTPQDFAQMILENLKTAGVQQAHKEDKIEFTALAPWPGEYVCAEGHYMEGEAERRAAIFIGPEFGTVQRQDLVQAAREAGDANFDVLIACAFNYEAHATEFNKLGRIPVLKARMNADLHMAEDLKNTGKGNLFVIFGEPDIGIYEGNSPELQAETKRVQSRQLSLQSKLKELTTQKSDLEQKLKNLKKKDSAGDASEVEELSAKLATTERQLIDTQNGLHRCDKFMESTEAIPDGQIVVVVFGVDVFHPNTGEVRSDGAEGIACWFIDSDYNDESFFVRHAYFLGQNDPYKSLKTTLKAEIDQEAWNTMQSYASRPFDKPKSGRIAVKVINHLGDEVMKVFGVEG